MNVDDWWQSNLFYQALSLEARQVLPSLIHAPSMPPPDPRSVPWIKAKSLNHFGLRSWRFFLEGSPSFVMFFARIASIALQDFPSPRSTLRWLEPAWTGGLAVPFPKGLPRWRVKAVSPGQHHDPAHA